MYFQRVLSSKSAATAEIISYLAAFGCIIMAVPPVLIGGIAKATSWNETEYFTKYNGTVPIPKDDTRMILPMVLKYLTPRFVTKTLMAVNVNRGWTKCQNTIWVNIVQQKIYRILFQLCVFLWSGSRVSSCDVLGRLLGVVSIINVRQECVQAHLQTRGQRE